MSVSKRADGVGFALTTVMKTSRQPTRFEVLLGRSLALGVHPYAAWRLSPTRVRAALVAGYVAVGYLGGFVVLTMSGRGHE